MQLGSAGSRIAAAPGCIEAAAASLATVYAGDASGRVWQLDVDCGQDVRKAQQLAEVPGQGISCLCSPGTERRVRCGAPALLAVGTAAGSLLLLARDATAGCEAGWKVLMGEQVDGAVSHIHVDTESMRVTATTACGTLWSLAPGDSTLRVLLCSQQQRLFSWHLAPGADWKRVPPAIALASAAGVAIWQLVSPVCVPGSAEASCTGLYLLCAARKGLVPSAAWLVGRPPAAKPIDERFACPAGTGARACPSGGVPAARGRHPCLPVGRRLCVRCRSRRRRPGLVRRGPGAAALAVGRGSRPGQRGGPCCVRTPAGLQGPRGLQVGDRDVPTRPSLYVWTPPLRCR